MKLAQPEIRRLRIIVEAAFRDVWQKKRSADVESLLRGSKSNQPDIADASLPLHIRLVERERLSAVATINWAESVPGNCEDLDYLPNQLLDPTFRQRLHDEIRCKEGQADRLQLGAHKLLRDRENSIGLLKLPPYSQEALMKDERIHAKQQEDAIERQVHGMRSITLANDDLLTFMDAHSDGAQFKDNRLLFKNDADAHEANRLVSRVVAAVQAK